MTEIITTTSDVYRDNRGMINNTPGYIIVNTTLEVVMIYPITNYLVEQMYIFVVDKVVAILLKV
jgi:hypothetical protein